MSAAESLLSYFELASSKIATLAVDFEEVSSRTEPRFLESAHHCVDGNAATTMVRIPQKSSGRSYTVEWVVPNHS